MVFAGHPLGPLGLGKYLLKEEGVDVDEGGLEQVQCEDGDFLVGFVGAGKLTTLTVEDNLVGAVPGLDDLSAFVYLTPELL